MATCIKGKSEKERQGHSDNDGTVSFLRLPFLILGDGGGVGSAVECGVLHDDTVADIVFCFVRCFGFRQNRFYVMIASVTTQTTIHKLLFAKSSTIFPFPLDVKLMSNMSRAWREQIVSPVATCSRGKSQRGKRKNSKSPLSLQAY